MAFPVLKWLVILVPAVLLVGFESVRKWSILVGGALAVRNRWVAGPEAERQRAAVLEERDRIARDLHDGVCQTLFFAEARLREAEECLRLGDLAGCTARLAEGRGAVRSAHDDLRQAVCNLKRSVAPEGGLAELLGEYLELYRRETGIQVSWDRAGLARLRLLPEAEGNLLKILQEALWNVRKHAGARSVEIEVRPSAAAVELIVRDDGRGCEAAAQAGGRRLGLRIMRERAALIGGEVEVRAGATRGTEVLVRLPARAWGDRQSA